MSSDNEATEKPVGIAVALLLLLALLFGITRLLKFRFVLGVGD
jgi:hypothetical protein